MSTERDQKVWTPTNLGEPPSPTDCELCLDEKAIRRFDLKGDGSGHLDLGTRCIRRLFGD